MSMDGSGKIARYYHLKNLNPYIYQSGVTKVGKKKRWTKCGLYVGNLKYNLTPAQEQQILELRHGKDLNFRSTPRMS